jgi:hypothetical protein
LSTIATDTAQPDAEPLPDLIDERLQVREGAVATVTARRRVAPVGARFASAVPAVRAMTGSETRASAIDASGARAAVGADGHQAGGHDSRPSVRWYYQTGKIYLLRCRVLHLRDASSAAHRVAYRVPAPHAAVARSSLWIPTGGRHT